MVDTKNVVSFACQRCLQPLKLDPSFNSIRDHTLAELSLPIHTSNPIPDDIEAQTNSLEHVVPPFRLTDSSNGTNDFMLVGDSGDTESLSHHMRLKATLFDIISSTSNADHPLCDECTDSLLVLMDQQLRMTEGEWADYNEFLKKLELEQNQDDEEEEVENLKKELQDMKTEEARMIRELEALKLEESMIKSAIVEQQKEKDRLDNEEKAYWRRYTKYKRDFTVVGDESTNLRSQLQYANFQLDRLRNTNVFNACFHIWHSGHFGTINTFRLGRLPSAPVDWSEINAAWGQTTLLLVSLARKINLEFQRYRLIPFGNHSYIVSLETQKELPLYGSGGFKFLWDTKFDSAMVAFLDCMQQFKEKAENGDSGFSLPYKMGNGRIEDSATGNSYSVKIQFNSEEQWTKALKFLLTNLKWGLAWVSSQFNNNQLVQKEFAQNRLIRRKGIVAQVSTQGDAPQEEFTEEELLQETIAVQKSRQMKIMEGNLPEDRLTDDEVAEHDSSDDEAQRELSPREIVERKRQHVLRQKSTRMSHN